MRLLTTTEALSLVTKDRLALNDRLGNALHRERYCLMEIERLKNQLKAAYGTKRKNDDFRPHP